MPQSPAAPVVDALMQYKTEWLGQLLAGSAEFVIREEAFHRGIRHFNNLVESRAAGVVIASSIDHGVEPFKTLKTIFERHEYLLQNTPPAQSDPVNEKTSPSETSSRFNEVHFKLATELVDEPETQSWLNAGSEGYVYRVWELSKQSLTALTACQSKLVYMVMELSEPELGSNTVDQLQKFNAAHKERLQIDRMRKLRGNEDGDLQRCRAGQSPIDGTEERAISHTLPYRASRPDIPRLDTRPAKKPGQMLTAAATSVDDVAEAGSKHHSNKAPDIKKCDAKECVPDLPYTWSQGPNPNHGSCREEPIYGADHRRSAEYQAPGTSIPYTSGIYGSYYRQSTPSGYHAYSGASNRPSVKDAEAPMQSSSYSPCFVMPPIPARRYPSPGQNHEYNTLPSHEQCGSSATQTDAATRYSLVEKAISSGIPSSPPRPSESLPQTGNGCSTPEELPNRRRQWHGLDSSSDRLRAAQSLSGYGVSTPIATQQSQPGTYEQKIPSEVVVQARNMFLQMPEHSRSETRQKLMNAFTDEQRAAVSFSKIDPLLGFLLQRAHDQYKQRLQGPGEGSQHSKSGMQAGDGTTNEPTVESVVSQSSGANKAPAETREMPSKKLAKKLAAAASSHASSLAQGLAPIDDKLKPTANPNFFPWAQRSPYSQVQASSSAQDKSQTHNTNGASSFLAPTGQTSYMIDGQRSWSDSRAVAAGDAHERAAATLRPSSTRANSEASSDRSSLPDSDLAKFEVDIAGASKALADYQDREVGRPGESEGWKAEPEAKSDVKKIEEMKKMKKIEEMKKIEDIKEKMLLRRLAASKYASDLEKAEEKRRALVAEKRASIERLESNAENQKSPRKSLETGEGSSRSSQEISHEAQILAENQIAAFGIGSQDLALNGNDPSLFNDIKKAYNKKMQDRRQAISDNAAKESDIKAESLEKAASGSKKSDSALIGLEVARSKTMRRQQQEALLQKAEKLLVNDPDGPELQEMKKDLVALGKDLCKESSARQLKCNPASGIDEHAVKIGADLQKSCRPYCALCPEERNKDKHPKSPSRNEHEAKYQAERPAHVEAETRRRVWHPKVDNKNAPARVHDAVPETTISKILNQTQESKPSLRLDTGASADLIERSYGARGRTMNDERAKVKQLADDAAKSSAESQYDAPEKSDLKGSSLPSPSSASSSGGKSVELKIERQKQRLQAYKQRLAQLKATKTDNVLDSESPLPGSSRVNSPVPASDDEDDEDTPFWQRNESRDNFATRYSPPIGAARKAVDTPKCETCQTPLTGMCEHEVEKLGWVEMSEEKKVELNEDEEWDLI
jgi:hypothetical protein